MCACRQIHWLFVKYFKPNWFGFQIATAIAASHMIHSTIYLLAIFTRIFLFIDFMISFVILFSKCEETSYLQFVITSQEFVCIFFMKIKIKRPCNRWTLIFGVWSFILTSEQTFSFALISMYQHWHILSDTPKMNDTTLSQFKFFIFRPNFRNGDASIHPFRSFCSKQWNVNK